MSEHTCLLALAASKHSEEVHNILVFWEDAVVVKVDIAAGLCGARAACQNLEEVNDVLFFWEDLVAVEVDAVAALRHDGERRHFAANVAAAVVDRHPELKGLIPWRALRGASQDHAIA